MPRRGEALAIVLMPLLTLAGCQHAPPPAPKSAPAPVIPAPPPAPPRQVVGTQWAFRNGENACTATASGPHAGLTAVVRRTGSIRLSISLPGTAAKPGRTTAVLFTGPAGSWQLRGTRARRGVEISLPLDDAALSRVLVLLSGGVVASGETGQEIPSLRLLPAGAAGRHWFECARNQLI